MMLAEKTDCLRHFGDDPMIDRGYVHEKLANHEEETTEPRECLRRIVMA